MNDHYFSTDPKAAHQTAIIDYSLKGVNFRFRTDSGVFSREKVDYGSNLLLKTLPNLQGEVLDMGCGYGVIGVSLARLNRDCRVTMADVNRRALALALENARDNDALNAQVIHSDGFSEIEGLFATIVSNPPIRAGKKIIYQMFEDSHNFLEEGGHLWLVIQRKQGAPSAVRKLESVYGNCTVVDKSGGYWIIRSQK
ncbi:MAG: class I SAM-dependent methyltransferase [Firmicutes bacterium]|nr:class I SAM-dependent methyltransferase [Bacillota bacterium]